jgi:hypothetical protein
MPGVSLSDATLKAVQAHGEGATASEVLNYLSTGISDDGPAEPPRYGAATSWPCRPARKS